MSRITDEIIDRITMQYSNQLLSDSPEADDIRFLLRELILAENAIEKLLSHYDSYIIGGLSLPDVAIEVNKEYEFYDWNAYDIKEAKS